MRQFRQMFVLVVALVATASAMAAPGDAAAAQDKYPVVHRGAKQLKEAIEALKMGEKKFQGHRVAAMKLIREALTELDAAVAYADKHPKGAKKTSPHFAPNRAAVAASQTKYRSIRAGARHVIDAGTALDKGLNKFGGHRLKALKALNGALDELETAVKDAK